MPKQAVDPRRQNAAANLLRLQTLDLALDALARAALPAVVLKGAAHLLSVYDDPGLRSMTDIDLWLPFHKTRTGGRALAALGFSPAPGEPGVFLRGRDRSDSVDISDAIWYLPKHDVPTVWKRALHVPRPGGHAVILSPEDSFLHTVAHGAIHHAQWEDKWTRDLEALGRLRPLDWKAVVDRGLRWGLAEALAWALRRAPDAFSTMGEGERDRLLRGRRPLRMWLLARLQDKPVPGRGHLLRLALQPRKRLLARHALDFLFPPPDFMRHRYALPLPLAYAWRPAHLALKAARAFGELLRKSLV